MAQSIRRIPSEAARRQYNRRFRMDFRMLMDDEPYDISDWDDVKIDVLDTNGNLVTTWTTADLLARPAGDRLLVDRPLPSDTELGVPTTTSLQYLLDLYRTTNAGAESFASMTLHIDKKLTADYAKAAANSEVIFVKFSSLAPGTTLEASSALSARMDSVESQVAGFVGGQTQLLFASNFTALCAIPTPLADTFVMVSNQQETAGQSYPAGQYILYTTNAIKYCLTGEIIPRL